MRDVCVYLQEHRGFGFVTFETDAAIQRVVSHGAHRLKGSTIAIDIAMPKVGYSVGNDNTHDAGHFKRCLLCYLLNKALVSRR